MKNPKLFREMSVPFASAEAANQAVEAFYVELGELRKKHKLTNVYTVINASYATTDPEDDEAEFFTSSMFGDFLRAESLVAWALGREQAHRQEMIAHIAKVAIKDARQQGHG